MESWLLVLPTRWSNMMLIFHRHNEVIFLRENSVCTKMCGTLVQSTVGLGVVALGRMLPGPPREQIAQPTFECFSEHLVSCPCCPRDDFSGPSITIRTR